MTGSLPRVVDSGKHLYLNTKIYATKGKQNDRWKVLMLIRGSRKNKNKKRAAVSWTLCCCQHKVIGPSLGSATLLAVALCRSCHLQKKTKRSIRAGSVPNNISLDSDAKWRRKSHSELPYVFGLNQGWCKPTCEIAMPFFLFVFLFQKTYLIKQLCDINCAHKAVMLPLHLEWK